MVFIKQLLKDLVRFSSKVVVVGIAVVSLAVIVTAIVVDGTDSDREYTRTISIEGSAKKKVSPDSVTITFGKNLRDKNIAKLQTDATRAINDLTGKLQKLGIAEKEIRTNGFNVTPIYNSSNDIEKYSINISVTVTKEGINPRGDLVGNMINSAIATDINEVRNLQFYLKDQEKEADKMEKDAIADAKIKAKDRAKSTGIRLGKVLNVYTNGNGNPYPMYSKNMVSESGAAEDTMAKAPTPEKIQVFQGEFDLETTVTLVYEIE